MYFEDVLNKIYDEENKYGLRLIDKIEELNPSNNISGLKLISRNENMPLDQDSFYPKSLMIEALDQLSYCLLSANKKYNDKIIKLSNIELFKFYKTLEIGDIVILNASIYNEMVASVVIKVEAYVNKDFICEGSFIYILENKGGSTNV